MGVVLAAFDPQLNRKIALKLLHLAGDDPEGARAARRRLLREAQAIAMLSHPNVISVYDVGEIAGSIYVAMEFVEGTTLSGWLEEQKRSVEDILSVFLQAAKGLAAAHQAGLVHRDFKPDNVLVSNDGSVRVSDFGLARTDPNLVRRDTKTSTSAHEDSEASSVLTATLTQKGVVVGTPRYMAPEQHTGQAADSRSDQFAFCVALYQALYGRDPFVAHSLEKLARAKQEGLVRPIPNAARVPSYLGDVVLRGLSADPDERYASMDDLVAALERNPTVWRNLVVAAVGVAVALSVTVGIGFSPASDVSTCEADVREDAEQWDAFWGEDAKAQLESMLVDAAPEQGAKAWAILEKALDPYVKRWKTRHLASCGAQRGVTPGVADVARRQCFETQLREVAAIVSVLEEIGPDEILRVTRLVSALPTLDLCLSDEYVMAQPDLNRERELLGTGIGRVQDDLHRVVPLALLGRYGDAVSLAQASLTVADELEQPSLVAECKLALGQANLLAGRYIAAEISLTEGVFAALRVRDDAAMIRAAPALVGVLGSRLQRWTEARMWSRLSRAALDRFHIDGPPVGKLDLAAGELALSMGDPIRARTLLERAVSVFESNASHGHPEHIMGLVALGAAQIQAGAYDEAKRVLERSTMLADEKLDRAHPIHGRIRLEQGRLAMAQGYWETAYVHFETAAMLFANPNTGAGPLDEVDVSVELGRLFRQQHDDRRARDQFAAALDRLETVVPDPHPTRAMLLSDMADADLRTGELERARLELAEANAQITSVAEVGEATRVTYGLAQADLDLVDGRDLTAQVLFRRLEDQLTSKEHVDPFTVARARFGRARARWGNESQRADVLVEVEAIHQSLPMKDHWLAQDIAQWLTEHR